METESKQNDGKTATITAKADYSKLKFMDGLEEICIQQPFDAVGCCLGIIPDVAECIFEAVELGELWEMFSCLCFCGYKGTSLYEVLPVNKKKQKLFVLKEESNCCERQCFSITKRALVFNALLPGDNIPLFRVDQPRRICACCSAYIMTVYVGDCMIGSIQENSSCCGKTYGVHDQNDNLLVKIDSNFVIVTPGGDKTGKRIYATTSGCCCSVKGLVVEFPKCMSTSQQKILLVAASMMITIRAGGGSGGDEDDFDDDDD